MRITQSRGTTIAVVAVAVLLLALFRSTTLPEAPSYDEQNMYMNGRSLAWGESYFNVAHVLVLGPDVYYALVYALTKFSTFGLRLITFLYGVLTLLIFHSLSRRVAGWPATAFAACAFALLSSLAAFQAHWAINESLMLLWSLGGFLCLFYYLKQRSAAFLLISGFLFGVAWFCKIIVTYELTIVLLFLWFASRRRTAGSFIRSGLLFAAGFLACFLVVEGIFWLREGRSYIYFLSRRVLPSIVTHSQASRSLDLYWKNFLQYFPGIFRLTFAFWGLGAIGAVFCLLRRTPRRLFILAWFGVTFAAAGAGGWWWPHYFIQTLPPLSLLCGIAIADFFALKRHYAAHCIPRRLLAGVQLAGGAILIAACVMNLTALPDLIRYYSGGMTLRQYLRAHKIPDWENRIDCGRYLKESMRPSEQLYVWDTTPLVYLASEKPGLDNRFVFSQETDDPDFLLASEIGAWPKDEIKKQNRQKLHALLLRSQPEYVVMRFEPEYCIPQLRSFAQLNDFVFYNYRLVKRFSDLAVYRKEAVRARSDPEKPRSLGIDMIRYYAAITGINETPEQVTVRFEPMVNTGGIVKEYTASYLAATFHRAKFEFVPVSVTHAALGTDGVLHLGFRPARAEKIWLARVKLDGEKVHWCNESYGVNRPFRIEEGEGAFTFLVPFGVVTDPEKTIWVDIIYDDGKLGRTSLKCKEIVLR